MTNSMISILASSHPATSLKATLISLASTSLAVDSLIPPNMPPPPPPIPPRPPRPPLEGPPKPPIILPALRKDQNRKPRISSVGRDDRTVDSSISDLYRTGTWREGSSCSSIWAFSRFRSKVSTDPMENQGTSPPPPPPDDASSLSWTRTHRLLTTVSRSTLPRLRWLLTNSFQVISR